MTSSPSDGRDAELLACPFCGGLDLSVYSNVDIGCWVACVNCGLETPTETGTTPDDAIKYWNTRAQKGQPDPDAWMREDGSAATVNPMIAAGWKGQGGTVVPLYAIRLATNPPDPNSDQRALEDMKLASNVREAVIRECRQICDGIADKYNNIARDRFKKSGEAAACAAREAAYEIEEAILAISPPSPGERT